MTYNAQCVRDTLNTISLNLGRDLFTIVGLICTMIVLDPVLTAIALLGGPFVFFFLSRVGRTYEKCGSQRN